MTTSKHALLVVDLQEDFCPPNGNLAVPSGRTIHPTINSLLALPNFSLRIATQDWHPRTHISFASNHSSPNNIPFTSQHTYSNPSNPSETTTITLWPDHCVQDTPGAALIPELDTTRLETIIKKGQEEGIEQFSGFRDSFREPCIVDSGLDDLLKKAGITDVFVTGLAAGSCVKHTALDAADLGYRTFVVWDAVKGSEKTEEAVMKLQEEFEAKGVGIVDSKDVRRMVGGV